MKGELAQSSVTSPTFSISLPPTRPGTMGAHHGHSRCGSWIFSFQLSWNLKGAMAGAENFVRKLKVLSPTSVSIQSLSKW